MYDFCQIALLVYAGRLTVPFRFGSGASHRVQHLWNAKTGRFVRNVVTAAGHRRCVACTRKPSGPPVFSASPPEGTFPRGGHPKPADDHHIAHSKQGYHARQLESIGMRTDSVQSSTNFACHHVERLKWPSSSAARSTTTRRRIFTKCAMWTICRLRSGHAGEFFLFLLRLGIPTEAVPSGGLGTRNLCVAQGDLIGLEVGAELRCSRIKISLANPDRKKISTNSYTR